MLWALRCSMQKSLHSEQQNRFLSLLRQVRLDQSVTQTELSRRIGMSQSDVSKVERGVRRLDVLELRIWLEGLDTSLGDFVATLEEAISADLDRNRRMRKKAKK